MKIIDPFFIFNFSKKWFTLIFMRFLSHIPVKKLINSSVRFLGAITGTYVTWFRCLLVFSSIMLSSQVSGQTSFTSSSPKARVVSLSGALTEIVYALGAQSQLVAVDSTSTFPAATDALPKVGYMRQLSAEGILAMRPTLLLATSEAGPANVIAQLKEAGIQLVLIPSDHSFEELRHKVRAVASALGFIAEGKSLEEKLQREMAAVQSQIHSKTAPKAKPRVLFVLSHNGTPSVSGTGTAADAFIKLAGARNAAETFKGYKPMTAEALLNAAPELILTTKQSVDALGGIDRLLERPGISLTSAGKNRRILVMEALYMLGFGPRLPEAVKQAWTTFSAVPTAQLSEKFPLTPNELANKHNF